MRWLSYSVLGIWGGLLTCWGKYWHGGPWLSDEATGKGIPVQKKYPNVLVVVPARNEEEHVAISLKSLLHQNYKGNFRVVLVDDESSDQTKSEAEAVLKTDPRLFIVSGEARPEGWSGKLWALHQGIKSQKEFLGDDGFILFTDADILHERGHLTSLVQKAQHDHFDMVSEMVMLQCETAVEKNFIPAFVYFFAMLYPFRKVADPNSVIAGAAGGTVLVQKKMLERIGGIASIKGALIDDCTLAARVKRMGGNVYLGCSQQAWSMRSYDGVKDIWKMIARTAYVQLKQSPILLLAVILGMFFIWFGPIIGAVKNKGTARAAGILAYLLSCVSFIPTLRWFKLPLWRALPLPLIAFFYSMATVGSAYNYYFGKNVEWHQRIYDENH